MLDHMIFKAKITKKKKKVGKCLVVFSETTVITDVIIYTSCGDINK
jgi:hypothetical protein